MAYAYFCKKKNPRSEPGLEALNGGCISIGVFGRDLIIF